MSRPSSERKRISDAEVSAMPTIDPKTAQIWFYLDGEIQRGPFTLSQLAKLANQRGLSTSTLVSYSGLGSWVELSTQLVSVYMSDSVRAPSRPSAGLPLNFLLGLAIVIGFIACLIRPLAELFITALPYVRFVAWGMLLGLGTWTYLHARSNPNQAKQLGLALAANSTWFVVFLIYESAAYLYPISKEWAIVGMVLGGIGVIPIAFVVAAIKLDFYPIVFGFAGFIAFSVFHNLGRGLFIRGR